MLKPNLVQRQTQLRVHNILAIPSLLYVCEIWTLKQEVVRRLEAAKLEFMRRTVSRMQFATPQKQ